MSHRLPTLPDEDYQRPTRPTGKQRTIEVQLRAVESRIGAAVRQGQPTGDLYLLRDELQKEFYA